MLSLLVLCTGNSARSILGEALINAKGETWLHARSAGSQPKGRVHPLALETLAAHGHPTDGYASKSWDVFAGPDAAAFDAVITVCDSAAAESCPIWPGAPLSVHWGLPDPAAIDDETEARRAFEATYQALEAKIDAFIAALPDADPASDRERLRAALEAGARA